MIQIISLDDINLIMINIISNCISQNGNNIVSLCKYEKELFHVRSLKNAVLLLKHRLMDFDIESNQEFDKEFYKIIDVENIILQLQITILKRLVD